MYKIIITSLILIILLSGCISSNNTSPELNEDEMIYCTGIDRSVPNEENIVELYLSKTKAYQKIELPGNKEAIWIYTESNWCIKDRMFGEWSCKQEYDERGYNMVKGMIEAVPLEEKECETIPFDESVFQTPILN
jgi:hypothetical protein